MEVRDRCYFFNTFFYKKLTEESGGWVPGWVLPGWWVLEGAGCAGGARACGLCSV